MTCPQDPNNPYGRPYPPSGGYRQPGCGRQYPGQPGGMQGLAPAGIIIGYASIVLLFSVGWIHAGL